MTGPVGVPDEQRPMADDAQPLFMDEQPAPTQSDPYYKRAYKRRDDLSKQASENARKLALAGLALVLLLGGVASDGYSPDDPADLPNWLIAAGVALIGALLVDQLQYVVGTLLFGTWARRQERLKRKNETLADGFPESFSRALRVLFWLKIAAVAFAYVVLLIYLAVSFT